MLSHLLVPLDGTPLSTTPLPLVRALARATDAKVSLLRTISGAHGDAAEQYRLAEEAESYLEGVARELRGNDLEVGIFIPAGDPAEQIVHVAGEHGVDLIVMATHARTGLTRARLGSVAVQVVASSPAPVVVVRPGGKRITQVRTLLVPMDGTPGGAVALGDAVDLARQIDAGLVLVQVVQPVPPYGYTPPLGSSTAGVLHPEWAREAFAAASSHLEGIAARLRSRGLEVVTRALLGAPSEQITRVAAEVDADMIVMSTHAITGVPRALLGSVAEAVVRDAARPVLLVRRFADQHDVTPATARKTARVHRPAGDGVADSR